MHLPKYNPKNHPLFNCGSYNCPICAKAYSQIKIKQQIVKENFSTEGVAPFVGRYGYPSINIGILAPPEENKETWLYDAPNYWSANNFQIPKIVEFRSSLINSREKISVKQRNKFLELNQEISMASKPTDVDINLKGKPHFRMNYDNYMAPSGPYAKLKKAKLTENPKIHTKVQKVHYDTDLKANDALIYLYDNKFDENFLSKILSVGNLGIGKNRKLVPTRWSITATDDTLGKHLINEIKKYNEINNYSAFFGCYLGNYYLFLCFPDVWSYELFEMHVSNENKFMNDYEPYKGRKYYAENTAGGYYTVRLAALEKLNKIKRQGSVLALRFITGDYTLPLGVFVTREAARKSMESKPIEFSSKELMLEYAKKLAKKKFNINLKNLLNKSTLLKEIKQQSKLINYL
jgi:DNA repair protein NreA